MRALESSLIKGKAQRKKDAAAAALKGDEGDGADVALIAAQEAEELDDLKGQRVHLTPTLAPPHLHTPAPPHLRTSAPPHSPRLTCLHLALLVSQVHAWVLVLAGKRMLEASLFLEPSTGE